MATNTNTKPYTSDQQKIVALQERPSIWKRARISLLRARWPILAIVILSVMSFVAVFGPQISPKDPNRQDLLVRLKAPGELVTDGGERIPTGYRCAGSGCLITIDLWDAGFDCCRICGSGHWRHNGYDAWSGCWILRRDNR